MRVRKYVAVGVLLGAVTLAMPGLAQAQGSGTTPGGSSRASPASTSTTRHFASDPPERLFAPPAVTMGETPKPPALPVLGEAWARAVRAVLDGMKRLVDAERIEAEQAVGGPVDARGPQPAARGASPREPMAGARVTPGRAVASVTTWRPSALREAIDGALAMMREAPKPPVSPVRLAPIAVAPPTDSPTDTRSEHVVLLGAVVELPWLVP